MNNTDKKHCSRCNTTKPRTDFFRRSASDDGLQGKCKKCQKELHDIYRWTDSGRNIVAANKRKYFSSALGKYQKKKGREKTKISGKGKAHSAVNHALLMGRLERKPCSICGNTSSQAHHEDYSKPLDVVWLCRKHHQLRHIEIRKQNELQLA